MYIYVCATSVVGRFSVMMMESFLVGSVPHASPIITSTGGNLWRNKNGTKKNIYHASSYAPKYSQHQRKIQNKCNTLKLQRPSLSSHYDCIEQGSANQESKRKHIVKAGSGPSFEYETNAYAPNNSFHSIKNFLVAVSKFCTPHIIYAVGLSTFSASLLALENFSHMSPLIFTSMLKAVIPYQLMHIYVTGVNQLFDIEIDKVNKPYFPLASGQLSFTTGAIIFALCATMSLSLAWIIGSWPFMCALLSYFTWGTAYSVNVPFLRWKRHPVLAAMCIILIWAFTLPISSFLHMQTFVLKRNAVISRPLIFVIVFMSLYMAGIALCKDIPDIEGDQKFGIDTFAARFGPKRAFWISVSLFETAFGIGILMSATSSYLWSKVVMGLGHAVLASILWYNAKSVDLTNKASIESFYLFLWKLLYGVYLIMPLVR